MPAFLSDDWVAAFNRALADLDPGQVGAEGSLVAADGRFTVSQVIEGVPGRDGPLTLTLTVDGPSVFLAAGGADAETSANVVLSVSYDDAAALAKGELDVVGALGAGKVRVRGDLSVLVAGQALLAAAVEQLGGLRAATTY